MYKDEGHYMVQRIIEVQFNKQVTTQYRKTLQMNDSTRMRNFRTTPVNF
jgi:hypothetical protein